MSLRYIAVIPLFWIRGDTYLTLCLDPAPSPFGASVSRTLVSTFLHTDEVSQQVTKVKGSGIDEFVPQRLA
jgi:hypothetical protein